MIGLPPLFDGAFHATVKLVPDPENVLLPGADGTVIGVAFTANDGSLSPIAFVAVTVNEYGVPLVRSVTTIGLDAPVTFAPVDTTVTVYDVTNTPLPKAGTENAIDTCPFPGVATTFCGA